MTTNGQTHSDPALGALIRVQKGGKQLMADSKAILEAVAAAFGKSVEDVLREAGEAQTATKTVRHSTLGVVINEGVAVQYGAVSITKERSNGFQQPMVGIFAEDLPQLIKDLQAAKRKLAK